MISSIARVSFKKFWGRGKYNLDGIAGKECGYITKINHALFDYANVVVQT